MIGYKTWRNFRLSREGRLKGYGYGERLRMLPRVWRERRLSGPRRGAVVLLLRAQEEMAFRVRLLQCCPPSDGIGDHLARVPSRLRPCAHEDGAFLGPRPRASAVNFREPPSVLKNSFALLSAPCFGAESAVFVVFWPCFEPLLDHRPGRQRLFQQPAPTPEVRGTPKFSRNQTVASRTRLLHFLAPFVATWRGYRRRSGRWCHCVTIFGAQRREIATAYFRDYLF